MKNAVFKKVISLEEAKALLEQLRQSRGCPSGFPALDKLSGGLVQDGVTLVAGRPAMGRTACVMNMVGRLSRQQEGTILVFSPQFWGKELAMLLLGIVMETDPEEVFDGNLPSDEIVARFSDYYESKKSNIKLDTTGYLSLDEIWEFCGAAFFEKDQKMIINHITFNAKAVKQIIFLCKVLHLCNPQLHF